jgi:hypothetical protein
VKPKAEPPQQTTPNEKEEPRSSRLGSAYEQGRDTGNRRLERDHEAGEPASPGGDSARHRTPARGEPGLSVNRPSRSSSPGRRSRGGGPDIKW